MGEEERGLNPGSGKTERDAKAVVQEVPRSFERSVFRGHT